MPKASLHYPKGWWVIGKAHFGNLQPSKEKKKKGLEFKPIGVQVKLMSTLYQWLWVGDNNGLSGWVCCWASKGNNNN